MAVKKISVTQLKCACLDPEWRNRWIKGENPSSTVYSPPGTKPVYGTLFHKIVEDYSGWLMAEKDAAQCEDKHALWHKMYEKFVEKKLSELLKDSQQIDSAYHIGMALKAFCARVCELRRRIPNFHSWQDLYLTKEFPIEDVRFELGETHFFISGQIDAVRTHPDYGLEIVDYKLSQGAYMKYDLLQLSIYKKLLEIIKPGLEFHGVLEYYDPELNEVNVSSQELETLFQELIDPVLYELAGEKRKPVAQNLWKRPSSVYD